MWIPEETVDEIRRRNDIVEIIGSYVPLKRAGMNYRGLCPFHNEKTPSFMVSGERQIYHCFGCGSGGNVITFMMEHENMTYPEAMRFLAERVGIVIPEGKGGENPKARQHKERILEVLKEAASYYYRKLRSEGGRNGLNYFLQRELSPEIMKSFGLGYAGKGRDTLIDHLKAKGYDVNIMNEAGLCVIDEKYGPRDRFFNRVIFPIQDMGKKVIGFGGRVMGDGEPKYLNSPETPVFNKSRNLYGYCFARSSRADNIILCEGYMDVIAMHQAGFTQSVASLGTALTPGQASLIGRLSKNVYISYDSDGAGVKAALRAIDILREAGISVKIMDLSPCKDPDELIKTRGREAIIESMKNAENAFLFKVRQAEKEFDMSDPDGRSGFLKRAASYLGEVSQEIDRENYLMAVSDKYKISPDIIRRQIRDYALSSDIKKENDRVYAQDRQAVSFRRAAPPDKTDKNLRTEKLLLSYLSMVPEVYRKIETYISPEDFTNHVCKRMAELLFDRLRVGEADAAEIVSAFNDPEETAFVAGVFYEEIKGESLDEKDNLKIIKDLLVKVKSAAYMRDVAAMGRDPDGLSRIIKGKKDIEQLKQMEIKDLL